MYNGQTIQQYGLDQRFKTAALQYPQWSLARVVRQHKGAYFVTTEYGECPAQISGRLRYSITQADEYPAVGDYGLISLPEGDGPAILHQLLPRQSVFQRSAPGGGGGVQVVAANVDVVFLCMSLNHNYNLSRMERYLSVAWSSGATPVILLTKADLCPDVPTCLAQVRAIAPFTGVLALSAGDAQGREAVLGYVGPGVTASFIGSSGVGKSTLINALLGGQALATGETGWQDKGRHTTTSREMLALPGGGAVIDTPGMRELGAEAVDLSASFSDIAALEGQCRFSNCTHGSEPGCAVRQALESGLLDSRRLSSYQKLQREAKYDGLTARELETTKANELFKDVGGMKNMRKYIRSNDKRRS